MMGLKNKTLNSESFSKFFNKIPIPTLAWQVVGEDFVLIDYNSEVENLTFINVRDILGVRATELFKDNEKILTDLHKCAREKIDFSEEFEYRVKTTGEHKLLCSTYIFIQSDLVITHIEDISTQRQINSALQEARDALIGLELLINQSPATVFLSRNEEGWPVEYITENIKQFGYHPSEFYSNILKFADIIHPDDLENVVTDTYLKCQKSTDEFVQEYRIVSKSGKPRWVNVRIWVKYDSENVITNFQGIILDITERKQYEEELKESDEKFRMITEKSLLGVAIFQKNTLKYINKALADLVEVDPSEVEDKVLNEFVKMIHPEDLPTVMEKMGEKLKGDKNIVSRYTFRIISKSGKVKWLEILSKTISYQGDMAILATLIDITEKKETEFKLKESEERLKKLNRTLEQRVTERTIELKESEANLITAIESMPFTFYIIDRNGKYSMQNTTAKKIWGNLIGKSPKDIAKDEDTLSLWLSNNKRVFSGETLAYEREYIINGELQYFYDMLTPIYIDNNIQSILGVNIDISERKQVEQKLKESEEKWRSMTENSPDFIITLGIDEKIIYINRSELLSLEIEDVIRKPVYNFIPEEFHKSAKNCFKRVITSGQSDRYYSDFTYDDGTIHYFESRVGPILNNGVVVGFIINSTDITKSKQAGEELKKFKNISDNANYGIGIIDLEGNLKYCNGYFASIHGYDPHEIIGKDLSIFHNAEQLERVIELKQKLLEEGSYASEEVWHTHKDGSIFPMLMNGIITNDDKGNALFMSTTAVDISKRQKIESRLKFLSRAVEQASEGIAIADMDGEITFINEAFASKHGYTQKELIGKSLSIFHTPEQLLDVKKANQEIQERGEFYGEIWHKHKNGTVFPTLMHNSIILNEQGNKIGMLGTLVDITKQKKMEQKLKESEEKFRLIAEQSLVGIHIFQDNRTTYVNQQWAEISGYSIEEIMNWDLEEHLKFTHPLDRELVREQVMKKQTGATDVISRYQVRCIKKTGVIIWVEIFGKTIKFKGKFADLVMIIDVTDKIKAEQRLKKSEEKYRFISENANDLICLVDSKWRFQYCNEAYRRILGYDPKELIGTFGFNFIHQEDAEKAQEQIRKSYNTGMGKTVVRMKRKDGIYRWIESSIRNFYDEDEKFQNSIGVSRDITEQKEAEQKLKESEEKYRLISENVNDLIYIIDKNGCYEYCNEAFKKILGYTPEDLIGTSALDLAHPEEKSKALEEFKDMFRTKTKNLEVRLRSKDGSYIWSDSFGKALYDENSNFVQIIGVSRDITEKKIAEEKLKESELKFKEAYNKAEFYKDIFTHDINNILSNIKSAVELSEIYLKDPKRITDMEELYDIIRIQFTKGSHLVSNIRKLSQIEDSTVLLKPFKVIDILKKEIDFLLESNRTRDIKIRTHGFEKDVKVNANELLEDLFNNLFSNSIKYNDNPVIEIDIKMSRVKKNNINYIQLEFLDNGFGIQDIRKDTIFQEEYVKDISSKGLGIGLTLVKKIMESYEGEIWVEDRIKGDHKQGVNFIVLIPEAV